MRALYLVRHGLPDFPNKEKLCIGKTDIGLSEEGFISAYLIGMYFNSVPFEHLIVSPLLRARQSAEKIKAERFFIKGFEEAAMGEWEGKSFDRLKVEQSDYYEKRGKDIFNVPTPGGESFRECQIRVKNAFDEFVSEHPVGDIVIVSHSGVSKMLMSALTGNDPAKALNDPMPYGGMMQLLLDGDKAYLGGIGIPGDFPSPVPSGEECIKLMDDLGTPENVISHGKAVCKKALEIAIKQMSKGVNLDLNLIRAAALLHDIAKLKDRHALTGAKYLLEKGYPSVAAIVGDHMTLLPEEEERVSEKTVVLLADKFIKDTEEVSLEERFLTYMPEDKKPYILKKYEQAKRLMEVFGI